MKEQSGTWRPGSVSRHLIRSLYDRYFNGDIQDSAYIWHYALPDGPSDDDLREEFRREAPFILLPHLLKHFPRHRWTGAQSVIASVALFSATHDLLAQSVPIWVGTLGADMTTQPQQIQDDARAIGSDEGYASDTESKALVPMDIGAAGAQPNWEKVNKQAKMDVKTWAKSDHTACMIILALAGAPLSSLMEHFLFVSGTAWEANNDRDSTAGKPRKFRILEAHKIVEERKFASRVLTLLTDSSQWDALPVAHMTKKSRGFAFRTLCRQAAGVYSLLALPRKGMPFALFRLLEDPASSEVLVNMPECLREDFSDMHMSAFGNDAHRLVQDDSLCVLSAIAETVRLDTARVETGHSFWQREVRARSLQTLSDSLEAASATWVMHKQRVAEMSCRKVPRVPKKRGRRKKQKATKPMTAKL